MYILFKTLRLNNCVREMTQYYYILADAAATFFNSNPRLVLDIASPIIEDTAATVSKALAARALSVLTKQELVP